MKAFTCHRGVVAALIQPNIDTDAIIPSREMKRVSKEGLGEGLFAAWRYTLPGGREPNPDFVLNQAPFDKTSILLGGDNFGCGSSREHAVWALKDFGIRAVIAPGFGSIFYNNCFNNGILPIILPEAVVKQLQIASANEADKSLQIDLQRDEITCANALFQFTVPAAERDMLLKGLDKIAITESHESEIQAFENKDRAARVWAYLPELSS